MNRWAIPSLFLLLVSLPSGVLGFWSPRSSLVTRDASLLRDSHLDCPSYTLANFADDVRASNGTAPDWCNITVYGSAFGGHSLCRPLLRHECFFMNYGVEQDFTFDTEIVEDLGCAGVALDPTVDHRPELVPGKSPEHPGVVFLKMAAPMLGPSTPGWVVMDPARLWRWLGRRKILALKYDCEGCEYALMTKPRDELFEEFLVHVHQVNVEFHLHRDFLDDKALQNLINLLGVLNCHGFHLVEVAPGTCGRDIPGTRSCVDALYDAGLPCEGHDCSSYLFSKVPR